MADTIVETVTCINIKSLSKYSSMLERRTVVVRSQPGSDERSVEIVSDILTQLMQLPRHARMFMHANCMKGSRKDHRELKATLTVAESHSHFYAFQ